MSRPTPPAASGPARQRVVRDPVLGYVRIPEELDPLVGSAAVQRLRDIAQNSQAVARYPGMTGSRFEHALGTMHLAIEAWHQCWNTAGAPGGRDVDSMRDALRPDVISSRRALPALDPRTALLVGADSDDAVEDLPLWGQFEHVVALTVGAVGMLHDLGHPPFSHILEPFFTTHLAEVLGPDRAAEFATYRECSADAVQFHEWAGLQIFDTLPDGVFDQLPRSLVRAVLADRSGTGWAGSLHSIIDGEFDVDRLDYLVRDAAKAGTEFGAIDVSRLLHSMELHRTGDGWAIGLGARAISAFETLLVQRAQHYRWVVHHYAVVAADTALERAVTNVHELTRDLPDLDYLSAAMGAGRDGVRRPIRDDHDCIAWLRGSRAELVAEVDTGEGERAARARVTLALLDMCDSPSVAPVPAWRNYQEFLARADQNPVAVARLVAASSSPAAPDYLRSRASRDAVTTLLSELPARLNAALDECLHTGQNQSRTREVEELLGRRHPSVEVCGGAGFWLVTRVPFMALKEDFANIWRGDEEVALAYVSPFPLALTAIEVMRPRYFVYFTPFDPRARDAGKNQRREVGRLFFETVAAL